MKVPLEPIPTEQIILVEKDSPRAEIRVRERDRKHEVTSPKSPSQLDKAYPWLLGASTCLSAVLCWMYVTKPVIAQNSGTTAVDSADANATRVDGASGDNGTVATSKTIHTPETGQTSSDLVPSDSNLPGGPKTAVSAAPSAESPKLITPGKLAASHRGDHSSEMGIGWESTNLKVQHILSADAGNGDLEKIVINVPVLYETRTMRWTSADIAKARTVMARLMVYERNLNNIRREGQAIMKDWNILLEGSVPTPALRADSPSLPYNHGQGSQSGGLPGSSSAIKVAQ